MACVLFNLKKTNLTDIITPTTSVCAIYRTPLGCYERLIRSDLFIYSSRRNVVSSLNIQHNGWRQLVAGVATDSNWRNYYMRLYNWLFPFDTLAEIAGPKYIPP